jgi:GrpB-like predicted nucleotidyltransferase (UPF0157 family)
MAEKIIIVPYDAEWAQVFSHLGDELRQALGDVAKRIDHIGSTSVVGLDAKPIIDIQISIASFELLDAYLTPLTQLGYVFRPDNSDLAKRYFREPVGKRRTHIHVRRLGSWSEQFALLFRDYLRTYPDEAKHYAALKYNLASQYGEDREGYTEAKSPFIWEIMRRADAWCQETGWMPGASDK